MPAGHLILGSRGEDAAAEFLKRKGYRILDRNWKSGRYELDIVCRKGAEIVFVEVKTRGTGALASPADALDASKRRTLAKAASLWLSAHDSWDRPCRIDLVSVVSGGDGLKVEQHENAFEISSAGAGGWQPW